MSTYLLNHKRFQFQGEHLNQNLFVCRWKKIQKLDFCFLIQKCSHLLWTYLLRHSNKIIKLIAYVLQVFTKQLLLWVGYYIPPKSSDILVAIQNRDANSLAISIPRGFGELGNGNLSFLGDQGNKNLFPGFRVGVRGNFGEYLVSDLKLIWNFFLLKRIFSLFFFKKSNK